MQKVEKKKDIGRRADRTRKVPCEESGYCSEKSMDFRVRILSSTPSLVRSFSTFVAMGKWYKSSKPHLQIGVNNSIYLMGLL